ncbi:hypothetical protein GGR21_002544 [Dysgonomonas hofstadii]|uniref:Uncharacterized protein n=1 Tax=Dysgonomonas hofstadii TaxID=637886 RepID=A0A840CR62_9BACT|nr:hypothetical protein [Dysgonomonas hofstadii]MBB4036638.1 hypothetical protein [Dysgonomonas hofstadii]
MKTIEEQIEKQKEVKEVYEKPAIEIIEMETEGILCGSGGDYNPGGGRPWS